MFLFLRMVLAHLIADYPLQTNRVYLCKLKSLRGQFLHAGIHTLTFTLFLFPYWQEPTLWAYLVWITLSHLLFDILKVKVLDKTNIHPAVTYLADQMLHILAASAIFLLPFSNTQPGRIENIFLNWYWDNAIILFLIGLLFSTFFTTYFLACWHWAKKKLEHDDGYQLTTFQKYYGFVERGSIFALILYCGNLGGSLSILFWVVLRLPVYQWRKVQGNSIQWIRSIPDFLFGTAIAAAAAIIIRSCH